MKKTNLSDPGQSPIPNAGNSRVAIVAAEWNAEVTNAMLDGAVQTLLDNGLKKENLYIYRVPGTYELTHAADSILEYGIADCVICIGCVIQGETRHFDFICQAVSQGLTNVSIKHGSPVIFSVLTTDTMEQALARAGGEHGNKGVEGAITALKMLSLHEEMIKNINI